MAGENTITVTVTRGSHTQTYTVVVTRSNLAVIRNDATLSALALSDVDIGTFDSATAHYTAGVACSVATTTVTAQRSDTGATVTISPDDADAGAEGHQVALNEGLNTITVVVESFDTTVNKTYTVVVARASTEAFGWAVLSDIDGLAEGNRMPRAMWSDGTTMWVTDLSGALFAYDLATGAHDSSKDITTLADTGNHNANGLWSDGTTMWVSDPKNNIKIFAYDLATGEMDTSKELTTLCSIWSLDPRASDNCHPAGLWSDGTTMWVVDTMDKKLYAYDLDTRERQAHLDFDGLSDAGNNSPKGIWSDGTTMWVLDHHKGRIHSYNMPGELEEQ